MGRFPDIQGQKKHLGQHFHPEIMVTRLFLSTVFLVPERNGPNGCQRRQRRASWGPFAGAPLLGAPTLRSPPFLPPAPFLCQLSSLIEASRRGRAVVNKCLAVNQELDWSRRGPA